MPAIVVHATGPTTDIATLTGMLHTDRSPFDLAAITHDPGCHQSRRTLWGIAEVPGPDDVTVATTDHTVTYTLTQTAGNLYGATHMLSRLHPTLRFAHLIHHGSHAHLTTLHDGTHLTDTFGNGDLDHWIAATGKACR